MAKKTVATTVALVAALVGVTAWMLHEPEATSGSDARADSTADVTSESKVGDERPADPDDVGLTGRPDLHPEATPTETTSTAPFRGTVVDPVGDPIPGARVVALRAYRRMEQGSGHEYVYSRHQAPDRATSCDAAGRFGLDHRAWADATSLDVLVSADELAFVELRIQRDQPARIILGPGTMLSVRVLGYDGRAVAGAKVEVLQAEQVAKALGSQSWRFEPLLRTETNAGGCASWPLGEGAYRLRIDAVDHPVLLSDEILLTGEKLREHLVQLDAGAPIRLRVHDAQGAPIAGAAVMLGVPNQRVIERITDETGEIRARGLPRQVSAGPGADRHWLQRAYFYVTAPGYAPSEGSRSLPVDEDGLDVTVQLARGFPARVRVVDDAGAPIEGASVTVELDRNGANPLTNRRALRFATDARGLADLGRLAPKHRSLVVYVDTAHETAYSELELTSEEVHEIVLARKSLTLRGRALGPDGRPVSGMTLGWAQRGGPYAKVVAEAAATGERATAEDGAFVLENLRAAAGALVLRAPGHAAQRHPLDLTSGVVPSSLVVRLQPAGRIAGRLVTRDGTAVAGVTMTLFQQYEVRKGAFSGTDVATATSDAEGHFEFLGVPEDEVFRIIVSDPDWRVPFWKWNDVRRGQEDLVVVLRARDDPVGQALRLRVTSGGRPYQGRLGVSWDTGERLPRMAREREDPEADVRQFGIWDDPGTYTFEITADGHRPFLLRDVTFEEGGPGRVHDVALERGAAIDIDVLDDKGAPLANVTLTLSARWDGGWINEQVTTDALGHCSLGGCIAGRETKVWATKQADRWTVGSATGVVPPARLRLTLRRHGTIRVRGPWLRRDQVSNVVVRALRADGSEAAHLESAPDAGEADQPFQAWLRIHEEGTFRIEAHHDGRTRSAEVVAGPGRRTEVTVK